MRWLALLALLLLCTACSTTVPVAIGECYLGRFEGGSSPRDVLLEEVDRVVGIYDGKVWFVFTFPNLPSFNGRWATAKSADKNLISEDYTKFAKRTRVKCPW